MESSPRSAGPRLQPAHHVQMRPVAPRLQVSNFQFTEGNAASTYGAPALNRGFSANPAFVPFEANVSALPLLNIHVPTSLHTLLNVYTDIPFFHVLSSPSRTARILGQSRVYANTFLSD